MAVSSVNANAIALLTSNSTADLKGQVQVSMLKKTLDAQESEAAALLKLLEGKGQTLDLRV